MLNLLLALISVYGEIRWHIGVKSVVIFSLLKVLAYCSINYAVWCERIKAFVFLIKIYLIPIPNGKFPNCLILISVLSVVT